MCVYMCVVFLCVCTQNKAFSPEAEPPPTYSYILHTLLLSPPASLAVKHIYNFHSSCTKTFDCRFLTSCIRFSFTRSLLLSIFLSFTPSLSSSQFFYLSLQAYFMFAHRSAGLSVALGCSFPATLIVFME